MQVEDFIKPYAEKLQMFKKTVFTLKHSHDFLQKLCERGDFDKMESELTKCLLNTSAFKENPERKFFISDFIEASRKYSRENTNSSHLIKTSYPKDTIPQNVSKIDKDEAWGLKKTPKGNESSTTKDKEKDFNLKKFKVKNKDEEFPTIENLELVNRRKNFEVLEHHFTNKLEKGTKICFCMSSKHPLVGNCVNCGRIQCLQEGDVECIVCGSPMVKKDDYLKSCADDIDMKKAWSHKEKLLQFQADFYSKLQIIDDFSDWYEISNNTWISNEHRELARKKDEENDRIRDDPEYSFNINFKTLEVSKVYEEVDDGKMKDDISNFFIESIRNLKDVKDIKSDKERENIRPFSVPGKGREPVHSQCQGITEKAILELHKLASERNKELNQKINYEQDIKKLSKRIDLDSNEKIGDQMLSYNQSLLHNIESMTESDCFYSDTDVGMCLSMHQPWASLLIEGLKRFEGREWDSDYRGILWIHATSKKPETDVIESVEAECKELYKNCKETPKFPKRYPTSCLLGCVDLVDVLKKDVYQKVIPSVFREKTESKFLFVCKNPRRLDIPIKMPGHPNLYKLDGNALERTKGKLNKVSTFFWPCTGLQTCLLEIPFNHILKPENCGSTSVSLSASFKTSQQNKKQKNNKEKLKISSIFDEYLSNAMLHVQNYTTKERKENILTMLESIKKDMSYHNDYLTKPYLNYGLFKEYVYMNSIHINSKLKSDSSASLVLNNENIPTVLEDLFNELKIFFRDEKKIKLELSLKTLSVEYIDWYGCQNFRENKFKSIKIIVGNPIIMSVLGSLNDTQGKSIKFECGDIVYIEENILYAINQVFYDTVNKSVKMKQGVCIITFNCISE